MPAVESANGDQSTVSDKAKWEKEEREEYKQREREKEGSCLAFRSKAGWMKNLHWSWAIFQSAQPMVSVPFPFATPPHNWALTGLLMGLCTESLTLLLSRTHSHSLTCRSPAAHWGSRVELFAQKSREKKKLLPQVPRARRWSWKSTATASETYSRPRQACCFLTLQSH